MPKPSRLIRLIALCLLVATAASAASLPTVSWRDSGTFHLRAQVESVIDEDGERYVVIIPEGAPGARVTARCDGCRVAPGDFALFKGRLEFSSTGQVALAITRINHKRR